MIEDESINDNPALEQIRARRYADKYRGEPGKDVHEIGMIFSKSLRNLVKADWNDSPLENGFTKHL